MDSTNCSHPIIERARERKRDAGERQRGGGREGGRGWGDGQ